MHWQGNKQTERRNLAGRSFPLEAFNTALKGKDIDLVSLQKGYGSEQLAHCSFSSQFLRSQSTVDSTLDFLECAAILTCCDLIVTSDSCLAHLSAGLGMPTWLLLNHIPDWRWGMQGEDTFWYPTMRIFRQKEKGDWDTLMEDV